MSLSCCYPHRPCLSTNKYTLTLIIVVAIPVICCFEQDVHGVMPAEQESDSEGSSMENLGDVTQFGLTGALAQMANITFMAGAPGICFFNKTQIFLTVVLETLNIHTE